MFFTLIFDISAIIVKRVLITQHSDSKVQLHIHEYIEVGHDP